VGEDEGEVQAAGGRREVNAAPDVVACEELPGQWAGLPGGGGGGFEAPGALAASN